MERRLALLRGINVGGGNKVPMADLRALCAELGWIRIETFIQTGNIVFEAEEADPAAALEAGIAVRFGLQIAVAVRTAAQWRALVAANPFPDAADAEPARLMVTVPKHALAGDAADALRERAGCGERVAEAAGALFIHYPGGAGRSKLMPGLIDRLAGTPCTSRNWRTVLALERMLAG